MEKAILLGGPNRKIGESSKKTPMKSMTYRAKNHDFAPRHTTTLVKSSKRRKKG
jgi:hypothetical protein